jgi:hypothetical protein
MNDHRYMLRDGTTPPPGSESTGWAFSDTVIQSGCPRCGSDAGYHCQSPSGRKQWPPHNARLAAEAKRTGAK